MQGRNLMEGHVLVLRIKTCDKQKSTSLPFLSFFFKEEKKEEKEKKKKKKKKEKKKKEKRKRKRKKKKKEYINGF